VDSVGSGQGPVADCCEHGHEPARSGATELVTYAFLIRGVFLGAVTAQLHVLLHFLCILDKGTRRLRHCNRRFTHSVYARTSMY
jgi:hypothetical protein